VAAATASFERQTAHVMDDRQRIALIETRVLDVLGADPAPAQLIRYQHGNHLGSVVLEVDEGARIVSYEEFHPYGSTAYCAVRSRTETPKRYRYSSKERDEETGFSYHGARYYAPWLGRWIAPDPVGIGAGINVYAYVGGRPTALSDPGGTDGKPPPDMQEIGNDILNGIGLPGNERSTYVNLAPRTPYSRELERRQADPADDLPGPSPAPERKGPASVQVPWVFKDSLHPVVPQIDEVPDTGSALANRALGAAASWVNLGAALQGAQLASMVFAPLAAAGGITERADQAMRDAGINPEALHGTLPGDTALLLNGSMIQAEHIALKAMSRMPVLAPIGVGVLPVMIPRGHSFSTSLLTGEDLKSYRIVSTRYNRERQLLETLDRFEGFEEYAKWLNNPRADVNIGLLRGSYAADFKAANTAAGLSRTPTGYTWHHHPDLGRMVLIPTPVHEALGHWGGVSIWKRIVMAEDHKY
jgi:RHS repeat-associated protein